MPQHGFFIWKNLNFFSAQIHQNAICFSCLFVVNLFNNQIVIEPFAGNDYL